MAMTEQQIQAKIDALTAKKKEIQKKERAKKKKALAKEKEAEAKKQAEINEKITALALEWFGFKDKEEFLVVFTKEVERKREKEAKKAVVSVTETK